MTNFPARPLVIYHGNCADGFGAAWVFHSFYGSHCDYYPGIHGEPPPDCTGRDVVLVDFSYPEATMSRIIAEADSVTVLDHHISAIHYLQPLLDQGIINGILDTTRSGAVLAWNWCYGSTEVPALLQYIQDRDLWQFKLPGSKEVNAAIFSYPYVFSVWDGLHRNGVDILCEQGATIIRKLNKDLDELLPQLAYRTMLSGVYPTMVANVPYTMSSDAGHWLLSQHMEVDVALTYYDAIATRVYSLRSREGGVDVAELAKRFGGGGHKTASGFKLSKDDAVLWERMNLKREASDIPF